MWNKLFSAQSQIWYIWVDDSTRKYNILIPHYFAVVYLLIYASMTSREVHCFDSTLQCCSLCSAVLSAIYYVTADAQQFSNHFNLFSTIPFCFKTYHSTFFRIPFPPFFNFFSSIPFIPANHDTRFYERGRVENHAKSYLALLVHFVEAVETNGFHEPFNIGRLHRRPFLK